MTDTRHTIARGLVALIKSLLVLVGVPAAVARLWLVEAPPQHLWRLNSLGAGSTWLHAVLLIVSLLWLWASVSLARGLIEALHVPGTTPNSWAARWASAIVGLVMLASAGSAVHGALGTTAIRQHTSTPAVAGQLESRLGTALSFRVFDEALGESPWSATLEANECLDGLAQRILGRADAWSSISHANMGRLQADGRRMVDPSLLAPGWCLELPAGPLPPTSPNEARQSRPSSSDHASRLQDLAVIGLGLLAAAGLARRVAMLRRLTASLRRPGERLRPPSAPAGELEAALRPFGQSRLIDWIDSANRLLCRCCAQPIEDRQLPDIRLVRAGPEGIEFLLAESITEAPAPFQSRGGGRWWVLDPRIGPEEAEQLHAGAGRFVPWLIPVGDDGSAAYLLALGPGRRLSLLGEEELAAGVLRSIVLSLRVLPWAEELEVALVGIDAPDPSEQSYQLESTNALGLQDLAAAPERLLVDRLHCEWQREPLVVIGDEQLVDATTLEAVNCRAGMIISGVPAEVELRLSEHTSMLEPFGIELNANPLGEHELDLIDRLLRQASAPAEIVPLSESVRANLPQGMPGREPNGPIVISPGSTQVAIEVQLLKGVVELKGAGGPLAARDVARVCELIAYLCLHGNRAPRSSTELALFGASSEQVQRTRLAHLYSASRSALARGGDGQALLRSEGQDYLLDRACSSDWARFSQSAASARRSEPRGAIALLQSALELVEARPFSKTLVGYRWVVIEGLDEAIAAQIVDAAHHLAVLALAGGDHTLCHWAIAKGCIVEPASEILVRDLLALLDAGGERAQIPRVFAELEARLLELGGNEPSIETRAYYEQLQRAHNGGEAKRL